MRVGLYGHGAGMVVDELALEQELDDKLAME